MGSIADVIATLGIWGVTVGTLLEGETVLVLAGVAARAGYLSLPAVIAAAFCGAFGNDQLFFLLGRRYAKRWLARRPDWQHSLARVQRLLERYPSLFVFGFRFFYGLRTVSPLVISTTRVTPRRFLLFNGLAAASWAALYGSLGYLFGAAAEQLVQRMQSGQQLALAIAAAAVVVLLLLHRYRRRRADRTKTAPPSSDVQ